MSAAFCRWQYKAKDPKCEAPVFRDTRSMDEIRKEAAQKVRQLFGGRVKGAKK